MIREVAVITRRPGISPRDQNDFEAALRQAPDRVSALAFGHLAENLPGSWGAGDYTWDGYFEDAGALRAFREDPFYRKELAARVEVGGASSLVQVWDAVRFEPQRVELPEPKIKNCVKRTAFFRVMEGAAADSLEAFERDTQEMPRYIEGIRNWAFSHPDPALGETPWTHIWEQEYHDVDGLLLDYQGSAFHWGYIDGWFDPECPQCIVAPELVHGFCNAASTILGWSG